MHFAMLVCVLSTACCSFPRGSGLGLGIALHVAPFQQSPLACPCDQERNRLMFLYSDERLHHELEGILLPESEEAHSPATHEAEHLETARAEAAHAASEKQAEAAKKPAAPHKKGSKSAKSSRKGKAAPAGTARAALKEGRENEQRPAKRAKSAQPKPSAPLVFKEPKYVALLSL